MASIMNPKTRIVKVEKVSTDAQDENNDGYKEFKVTTEVTFSVWSEEETGVRQNALSKLDHALS